MKKIHVAGFGFSSSRLGACAATRPVFDMQDCLSGPLTASCVFLDAFGRMRRHFAMNMVGRWESNRGALYEQLRYDDDETGTRRWNLTFAGDESLIAIIVSMEDWFSLVGDGTLINRARISKFGIKVGELVAWFRKHCIGELELFTQRDPSP